MPVVSRVGLESPWQQLSKEYADAIVKKFELKAGSSLRILVEGSLPNPYIVFNVGAGSAAFVLPPSQIDAAKNDFKLFAETVQAAQSEGKTGQEMVKALKAGKDATLTTTAIVTCAWGIAIAYAEAGLAIPMALLSCGGAIDAVNQMVQEAHDQAERDAAAKARANVSESPGAGEHLDGDKIERFERTA